MYYWDVNRSFLLAEKGKEQVKVLFVISYLVHHKEGIQSMLTAEDVTKCLLDDTKDYTIKTLTKVDTFAWQILFKSFMRALLKLSVEMALKKDDRAKSTFAFIMDNYSILDYYSEKEISETEKKKVIKEIVYSFTKHNLDELVKVFKEIGV